MGKKLQPKTHDCLRLKEEKPPPEPLKKYINLLTRFMLVMFMTDIQRDWVTKNHKRHIILLYISGSKLKKDIQYKLKSLDYNHKTY